MEPLTLDEQAQLNRCLLVLAELRRVMVEMMEALQREADSLETK